MEKPVYGRQTRKCPGGVRLISRLLGKIVHIYIPEDSGTIQKPNSTESHYFRYVFARKLEGYTISIYPYANKTEYHRLLKKSVKKNDGDLFFVVTDVDYNTQQSNIAERRNELLSLANSYKRFEEVTIYISARSWEVWMAMYNGPYTKPYVDQKSLNKDVSLDYEKKKIWYSKRSEYLFQNLDVAKRNCQVARKTVVANNLNEVKDPNQFIDTVPQLTQERNINIIFKLGTISYVDFLVEKLRQLC